MIEWWELNSKRTDSTFNQGKKQQKTTTAWPSKLILASILNFCPVSVSIPAYIPSLYSQPIFRTCVWLKSSSRLHWNRQNGCSQSLIRHEDIAIPHRHMHWVIHQDQHSTQLSYWSQSFRTITAVQYTHTSAPVDCTTASSTDNEPTVKHIAHWQVSINARTIPTSTMKWGNIFWLPR